MNIEQGLFGLVEFISAVRVVERVSVHTADISKISENLIIFELCKNIKDLNIRVIIDPVQEINGGDSKSRVKGQLSYGRRAPRSARVSRVECIYPTRTFKISTAG